MFVTGGHYPGNSVAGGGCCARSKGREPADGITRCFLSARAPAGCPDVERAMAVCLRSDPVDAPCDADPLTADWCTRWVRDVPRTQAEPSAQDFRCDGEVADGKLEAMGTAATSAAGEVTVGCSQVICAPTAELIRLRGMVEQLAARGGFRARLMIRED